MEWLGAMSGRGTSKLPLSKDEKFELAGAVVYFRLVGCHNKKAGKNMALNLHFVVIYALKED